MKSEKNKMIQEKFLIFRAKRKNQIQHHDLLKYSSAKFHSRTHS